MSLGFGVLAMMLGNEQNNKMAIQSGLAAALNTVIVAEEITSESIFSKAFMGEVSCLVLSAREETMVVQFSNL